VSIFFLPQLFKLKNRKIRKNFISPPKRNLFLADYGVENGNIIDGIAVFLCVHTVKLLTDVSFIVPLCRE
jgi:hypothetical protein